MTQEDVVINPKTQKPMTQKKLNWFDILMGIGIILVIALGIYLATRVNKAQAAPINIPTMEYGDCEPDIEHPTDTVLATCIQMYPDCVMDFMFIPEENLWVIEYSDDDSFDYDNIYPEDWSMPYISIECSQDDFFSYLQWYATINDSMSDAEYESNNNYYIREVMTYVEGGPNYRYYLTKK